MCYSFALIYFALVNIIGSVVCCYDKYAARKGLRRVPEKTLFMFCVLGGSVAMYVTMRLIRHKTKHKRFMIGIPIIFILQVSALLAILSQLN